MPTRLAAQKALQRLWNINPDLSEDDEIGIDHDGEPLMVASDIAQVESDSQSDSDDSDVNEDQALEMVGKDQTIWKNVNNNSQLRGRMPSDNVFIVTPGVKPSAKRMIDSPESAWRLLITENIMKRIEKHTTDKASLKSKLEYKPSRNRLSYWNILLTWNTRITTSTSGNNMVQ